MPNDTTKPRQPRKQASPTPTMMAGISSIIVGPRSEKLDRAKVTRYRQALRRGDRSRPLPSSSSGAVATGYSTAITDFTRTGLKVARPSQCG